MFCYLHLDQKELISINTRDYVIPTSERKKILTEMMETAKKSFTRQELAQLRERNLSELYRAHLPDDIATEIIAYLAYNLKSRIRNIVEVNRNTSNSVYDSSSLDENSMLTSRKQLQIVEGRRNENEERSRIQMHEAGIVFRDYTEIDMPEGTNQQNENTRYRMEQDIQESSNQRNLQQAISNLRNLRKNISESSNQRSLQQDIPESSNQRSLQQKIDESLLPVKETITEIKENIKKIADALKKSIINVEEIDDKHKCSVCYLIEKCIMFVPCKHLACCEECAKTVMEQSSKCPICNNYAQYTEKIYI